MTAIISTTYDDKYFFFLPIVTRALHALDVNVCVVMPEPENEQEHDKIRLANTIQPHYILHFKAPEHKKATYAQIARLYACANITTEDEIFFTSDIDMLLFRKPIDYPENFVITGADLVPHGQLPMCYISAPAKLWREVFIRDRSLQQCLDDELSHEECENMRGNLWSRDQEIANNTIRTSGKPFAVVARNNGHGFAVDRIDRDDAHWQSYLLPSTFDAHLWRPGYTPENVARIIQVLQYFYPNDSHQWIAEYAELYRNNFITQIADNA